MWDGFNKRKFPRVNLKCEITVSEDSSKGEPCHGITENVGMGGVAVILGRQLERFTRCTIRLELNPPSSVVMAKGRVVWTIPTQDSRTRAKCFDTGIEFVDLPAEQSGILREFVERRIPSGFREVVP